MWFKFKFGYCFQRRTICVYAIRDIQKENEWYNFEYKDQPLDSHHPVLKRRISNCGFVGKSRELPCELKNDGVLFYYKLNLVSGIFK